MSIGLGRQRMNWEEVEVRIHGNWAEENEIKCKGLQALPKICNVEID